MARALITPRSTRYQQLTRVAGRLGLGWLLAELGLRGLAPNCNSGCCPGAASASRPVRMREALEELGTTFVKFGQLLSTRPGLVPPEYAAELSQLQDSAPTVPYEAIAGVIESELGRAPEGLFASFEREPLAAASIGQVHAARLWDGTAVVVKVQRPGVGEQVEEDLAILGELARLLAQRTRLGERYDFVGWVEEFAGTLRAELDYLREGHNAERIRWECAREPELVVPRIYWSYTSRRVLTMEEIQGITARDGAALERAGVDRRAVAEGCARIALTQIFEHGFFHADPHPGNFFVLPDGKIGLIDFGMVGTLEERLRDGVLRLGLAVIRKDADRVIDELAALGCARGKIERPALKRDLTELIQEYYDQPVGETCAAPVVRRVAELAARHRLQLPRELTLFARVVAMCEGLGATLDPGFRLREVVEPYFQRFWLRAHSPDALARRLLEGTEDLLEMSPELPRRLGRLLGQLERGELTVTSRSEDAGPLLRQLSQAGNRIAASILLSGALIGLSVMALAPHSPARPGSCGLWTASAFIAGAVAGMALLAIFRRRGR